MSRSTTQLKERLLETCFPITTDSEPVLFCSGNDRATPLKYRSENFSLECLLRAIQVENRAGLLSRINYYFPQTALLSAREVLGYAEVLNRVLAYSQVFVVQDIDGDIDGDCGYFLRMDTLLKGRYERDNISSFLDDVTQDVETTLDYFRNHSALSSPALFSSGIF